MNGPSKDQSKATADNLYHIILTQSRLQHDVNSKVEKVRVCDTYTNLEHAKAAAHRSLFDAGYEREFFTEYDVKEDQFPVPTKRKAGMMVYAVAQDKTTFIVTIATTPNVFHFETDEDGMVPFELYHVLQTTVDYGQDESGLERETVVEGSFRTYGEAEKCARQVLLDEQDGLTKSSYDVYDEAAPGERDCGWGENVLIHAVGDNGINYLVSVVKSQELESVRLAEAAMRMR